jgi:hypothetical protein
MHFAYNWEQREIDNGCNEKVGPKGDKFDEFINGKN